MTINYQNNLDCFKYFSIILFLFYSCTTKNQSGFQDDNDLQINVAYQFLEILKTNDTSKVKSLLVFGLLNDDPEGFFYNVNLASKAINKYGLPKKETILLDNSVQIGSTAVVFPIYKASNPNEKFQKAIIKVYVQKVFNRYQVVFFVNEFQNKIAPIVL